MKKKRVVSGIRPTGRLHLGHLHGALLNWKKLQDEYECFYFIADWHALTSEYARPEIIKKSTIDIILDWLAVGLDPEKCTFFVQSQIKEHAELHLIFSMITPIPWLERNPTYKEQIQELSSKNLNTYGFLGYPVLQAADILMYKADAVPVGEDQAPHIELTREIARRFNFLYKKVFPEPETMLTPTSKLLGIDRRKMSKSYNNAIFITEPPEEVSRKVSQMITDPQRGRKTDPGRPSFCNVFFYHEIYTPADKLKEIEEGCKNAKIGCVECKKIMAENLNKGLEPIREKRKMLESKMDYIENIINEGNKRAREIAQKTMIEVREAIGI